MARPLLLPPSVSKVQDSVDDDLKASPHLLQRQDQISQLDRIQSRPAVIYLPAWDNLVLWQDKPMGARITQFGGK